MVNKNNTTRRDFLKRTGLAIAAPYIISASALGQEGRPPASERIVMAGIGVGSQGGNDMGAFLQRPEVQYVALCDVKQSMRDRGQNRVNKRYANKDCAGLQGLPRVARPQGYRCRTRRHAGPLARHHHHRGLPPRQRRVLPEARIADDQGRPRHGQAARRYGCVVSGGSQRVLDDHGELAESCWNGEKGTIKEMIRPVRAAFNALFSAWKAGRQRR